MQRLSRGKVLVGELSIDAQDITIADDLVVGDKATVSGDLSVTGNLAVNTNKFTVASSSGNVTSAGKISAASFGFGNAVANIADPSGVTTDEDVEARAAIAAILDALETVGIVLSAAP